MKIANREEEKHTSINRNWQFTIRARNSNSQIKSKLMCENIQQANPKKSSAYALFQ